MEIKKQIEYAEFSDELINMHVCELIFFRCEKLNLYFPCTFMDLKHRTGKHLGALHLCIHLIFNFINIWPLSSFSKTAIVKTRCSAPEYL